MRVWVRLPLGAPYRGLFQRQEGDPYKIEVESSSLSSPTNFLTFLKIFAIIIIAKRKGKENMASIEELERQIFDEHIAYLREKSRADGAPRKLAKSIWLELEGLEDIAKYLDPQTKFAIIERVVRIKKILKEKVI